MANDIHIDCRGLSSTLFWRLRHMTHYADDDVKRLVEAAQGLMDAVWNEAIEACAVCVEPRGKAPCDCTELLPSGFYIQNCYCQNGGDLSSVEAWCACINEAKRIRALKRPTQPTGEKLSEDVPDPPCCAGPDDDI